MRSRLVTDSSDLAPFLSQTALLVFSVLRCGGPRPAPLVGKIVDCREFLAQLQLRKGPPDLPHRFYLGGGWERYWARFAFQGLSNLGNLLPSPLPQVAAWVGLWPTVMPTCWRFQGVAPFPSKAFSPFFRSRPPFGLVC